MARRYQQGELLHLRDSPLVHKPPGLPPVEAWMGPPPEQAQKKPPLPRNKSENPGTQNAGIGLHSSFAENRRLSRAGSNLPSDIDLGPPRSAFTPNTISRNSKTPLESPRRAAFAPHTAGFANMGYFGATREKILTGKDRPEDVDEEELRGPKTAVPFSRRNGKEESGSWDNARSGKSFGPDDLHRGFRKHVERESNTENSEGWGSRRQQTRGFDSHRKEEDSTGVLKNGAGRNARSSWGRENVSESQEIDGGKENAKNRDGRGWRDNDRHNDRDNRRNPDRDRHREYREEQAPEWADEPATNPKEGRKETHTADDIEKWKASMRADKAATTSSSSKETCPSHERTASGAILNPKSAKSDTPLMLDPSFDPFTEFWGKQDGTAAVIAENRRETQKDYNQAKPMKASKFTGFFSPKPVDGPPPPSGETPVVATLTNNDTSEEDKVGFQRIMQMLGGNIGNANPNMVSNVQAFMSNSSFEVRPPSDGEKSSKQAVERKHTPPIQQEAASQEPPTIYSPRSRRSIGFEGLLGHQSPREIPTTHDRNSEFLLGLMQSKESNYLTDNNRLSGSNASGLPTFQNSEMNSLGYMQPQPHPMYHQIPRGEPLNEIPYTEAHHQNRTNPSRIPRQRRGTQDFYDEPTPPMGNQRQVQFPSITPFNLPPNLQRPPGFEHNPAANYSHQLQQQQQLQSRQNMVAPPPGFPSQQQNYNIRPPNPGGNGFPPGLIPSLTHLNLDRNGGPDKIPAQGYGGVRLGGNGMPPPGFAPSMLNGPPPPGFGPMGMYPQRGPNGQEQDGRISPTRLLFNGNGVPGPIRPGMLEGFAGPDFAGRTGRMM
ncbi:hypothetical protein MMC25_007919 [Agyrium rufum]|nr:hypothetical protein [Agyrium rufum]